jgi:ATP-dependent Clp protease ATP-binding subunit ClpA
MFIPFASQNQFDPDAGAFINVTGFESNKISEYIKNISHDEMMYRQSQPILLKEPNFTKAIAILKNLLEQN